MPAEYSKDPVNMNRKQWEKEQSWSDFIEADVKYCRGVAEDYEHFLYLLEGLGYEVKQGAHLAVKADKMRRFRRLDTIREEYSKENLETFFAKGSFAFETPRVLTPDVKYLLKPKNPYQQKFYAKLYRMRVVEKCRFQYKSARFKEDLERMHMLQEEYLFLRRKDINGVANIVTQIGLAEFDIKKLTEKQKTLYQERADLKRKCVTDNNILDFYTSEPEYRKQLEDIKSEKKKLQGEKHVAERCLKESLYVGLLVPEDIEIGNVYEIDVPKKPWSLGKDTGRNIIEAKIETQIEAIEVETDIDFELNFVKDVVGTYDYKSKLDQLAQGKKLSESEKNLSLEAVTTKTETNTVTKVDYEAMSDIEKARFMEIDLNDVTRSIIRFSSKLKQLGIEYKYNSELTDEFCRIEDALTKTEKQATKDVNKISQGRSGRGI